jgi:hypothetical protein
MLSKERGMTGPPFKYLNRDTEYPLYPGTATLYRETPGFDEGK